MTRLLARTDRIRFGIATIILPLRDPVLLAKQMATLDGFAPGRAILGVGGGRYEDEFASLGSEAYPVRGRMTDEYTRTTGALGRDEEVSVRGKSPPLGGAKVYPKPLAPPPIW